MADEPDATPIDPSPPPAERRRNWHIRRVVNYGFLTLWVLVALWNLYKPLPDGTRVRGEVVETPLDQLQFLSDVTSADVFGAPVVRQQIFDAMLGTIGRGAPVHRRGFLPVQRTPRRGQRHAAAPCPVRRAARCAAGAQARACRDSRCWSSAIPSMTCTAAVPRPISPRCASAGIEVVVIDLDAVARFELHLLGVLAPHHEMVVRRRLGGWLAAESAGGRPRRSDASAPGRGCSTSRPITARC